MEQEARSKMIRELEYRDTQPISVPPLLDQRLHFTENQSASDLLKSSQVTEQESHNLESINMATSDNTKPTIPAKDSLEQDKSIQSKNRYQNNKSEGDSAQEIAQVTPNTPNVSEYTVTESKDGNEILQDEIADQLKHETVDKKIDNQPYPVELSVERNQENHLIINTDEQINFTEDLDGSYHEICENNIEIKSVKSEESQSKSLNVAPLVSRRQENESSKAQNDSVIHRISKTSLAGEKSSINENIGQINNHSTITSVSLEND